MVAAVAFQLAARAPEPFGPELVALEQVALNAQLAEQVARPAALVVVQLVEPDVRLASPDVQLAARDALRVPPAVVAAPAAPDALPVALRHCDRYAAVHAAPLDAVSRARCVHDPPEDHCLALLVDHHHAQPEHHRLVQPEQQPGARRGLAARHAP